MKTKGIPKDVKERAIEIIEAFNEKTFRGDGCYYQARFKGRYLYLDRCDYGNVGPICRLTYAGNIGDWEFAIFKWSTEAYDAEEWMFPGGDFVDGTIKGAMKAGIEAYPP